MSLHILEKCQIVSGFVPVNLATAANTGDYISMKNFRRCAVIFFAAAGTAGDDPTITLTQAQDVGGTGVKNLTFPRIDVKQGADLFAIGQFTTIANADHDYTHTDAAEAQKIWVIDVRAEDLDIANGFDCLKAVVSDVGTNAQIGCALYILHEPRFSSDPLPSGIAN